MKLASLPFILGLALLLSLSACSNKQETSALSPTDLNSGIEAGGGDGNSIPLRDSGGPDSRDLCSIEGDAYERFAKLTHQPRDLVYQIAQSSTFHSLYQAKPATYTKEDLALMQNYYVQADKALYGTLSAQIEGAMVRFGGSVGTYGETPTAQNWESMERAYAALQKLLRLRQTLYAAYSAVFGLQGAIAWAPAYDGAIANVTPIREFLNALNTPEFAAEYQLNNFRKERIRDAVAALAQGVTLRVAERDYVVHANYSVEKKTVVVRLVEVSDVETALEFRPATDEVMTALSAQVDAIALRMKDLEAQIDAAANPSAQLAAYKQQYAQLQAEASLLRAAGYSEAVAVTQLQPQSTAVIQYQPGNNLSAEYEEEIQVNTEFRPTYQPSQNFNVTADADVREETTRYTGSYSATYNQEVRMIWHPVVGASATTETRPSTEP